MEDNKCACCGKPGATYKSVFIPDAWLCENPVECLERFVMANNGEQESEESER